MTLDTYSILLDANIHLSKTLRDWIYLLSFATEELVYEIFHTRDIQAEVDYHTRRKFRMPTATCSMAGGSTSKR